MIDVSFSRIDVYLWAAIGLLAILGLVNLLVLWRLKAHYRRLRIFETLFADYPGAGMEKVLEEIRQMGLENLNGLKELQERVTAIEKRLSVIPSILRVKRYKAFPDVGGDLSFSLAILSEQGDGAVITGLHGRENSMVWVKPVQGLSSPYPLSEEERSLLSSVRDG